MGKLITKKILEVKLMKVEKSFRDGVQPKYYYNFLLEDIEDPVVVEVNNVLEPGMVGQKLKYRLNENFDVLEFDII
jgi:hypothetical protein